MSLNKLTGRQVASLMLCAKFAAPETGSSFGFASETDGPTLAKFGYVVQTFPGCYRATHEGARVVAGLVYFDRFAADLLGPLPYSDRSKHADAILEAWTSTFSRSAEIEKQMRGAA